MFQGGIQLGAYSILWLLRSPGGNRGDLIWEPGVNFATQTNPETQGKWSATDEVDVSVTQKSRLQQKGGL